MGSDSGTDQATLSNVVSQLGNKYCTLGHIAVLTVCQCQVRADWVQLVNVIIVVIICGFYHQECIVPLIAGSVQSGQFLATLTALGTVSLWALGRLELSSFIPG